jgi:hypothetical protein
VKNIFRVPLDLINRYSTGTTVIILFVIAQIIYFLMLFYTIPIVTNFANGMEIFDLQPTGFSSNYALTLLEGLGAEGRDYYLYRQIPLDMIYPSLFGISFSLLLNYIFKKAKLCSKYYILTLIPLFAGLFDYIENIGIILMLTSYPSFSSLLANVTSLFSILKSISTTLFFLLLFIGFIRLILIKYKKSS